MSYTENDATKIKKKNLAPEKGIRSVGEMPAGAPQETPVKKTVESSRKRCTFWSSPRAMAVRRSELLNLACCLLIPMVTLLTAEWIARGTLGPHKQGNGFFEALGGHFLSFFVAYLFLVFIYTFISHLVGSHTVATLFVGGLGVLPAVVTYYKLTMRNEPFLPWDITQVGDLMGVKGEVTLDIQTSMIFTILIFILMSVAAYFVILPRRKDGKPDWKSRLTLAAVSGVGALLLLFLVFLSPKGTAAIGIQPDMWMQDRYYRTNGVVTGFLTNLQLMNIDEPEGYSQENVEAIARDTENHAKGDNPLYGGIPAESGIFVEAQPDIIYVMAESFWDVTALPGIAYDRDLLPNLTALSQQGARGKAYTPSFGGGTCDVEFEALTGFSMEFLPAGSKPYQQYVTQETFSLPQLLKEDGYETLAIHGYGRNFWNRDQAYPRLGIDTFIAQDEFVNPTIKRGFISDDAMVDRIIEEHQNRASEDNPVFIHAVTMQNHTTYDRSRYPAEMLVKVTQSPVSIPDKTIGQLEDCATGIYEMDKALGRLTDYLRTVERPTIVVFWGDHLNPMSDGYNLFEKTGFIENDDTSSPALYQTPLLIWNNKTQDQVDLGTVAAYNISPLMMDLYGLEKPLYFEFLHQQMSSMRVRTKGHTVNPDGSVTESLSEQQQMLHAEHAILQYDEMFGEKYLKEYQGAGE